MGIEDRPAEAGDRPAKAGDEPALGNQAPAGEAPTSAGVDEDAEASTGGGATDGAEAQPSSALAALSGDQSAVGQMRAEFQRRSRAFVDGLNRIRGFSARMPGGAFYVFANITGTGWPSKRLANALLEEGGVAALSGTAFGSYGEGYLRFSVANSMENLMEALKRIEVWAAANL